MNTIYINQLKQDVDGQGKKSKPFFMTFLLILMTLGLASISHAKAPINTALETVESYLNIWNGTQPDDLTKVLDPNVEYFNTSNEETRKGTASAGGPKKYDYPLVDGKEMTTDEKKRYRQKQRSLASGNGDKATNKKVEDKKPEAKTEEVKK